MQVKKQQLELDMEQQTGSRFSSVQSLCHVQLFAIPWTAAHQASLSITNSCSPPKPMSIESMMPYNHLILCRPFLLLPSIFPSIRVFSNESPLCMRWPNYWSFNFNISPSNEHPGLISFRMDWLDLLAVQGTLRSLPPAQCVSGFTLHRSSRLRKEYVEAVYCHPAYLTYMQSMSCKMLGWMKHKLE